MRPAAEGNGPDENRRNMVRTLAEMLDRYTGGSGSKDKRPKDKQDKRVATQLEHWRGHIMTTSDEVDRVSLKTFPDHDRKLF